MKVGVLLASFLLASCALAGGIKWEYEQFCERRPAYPSEADSPVATFRVSAMRPTLPAGLADQQASLERFICSYLTIPYYQIGWGRDPFRYGSTVPEAVRSLCDAWYEEYAAAAQEALEGGPLPIFLSGWFYSVEGRVEYLDERYLVYRVKLDEYEGGVHPAVWYRYLVWDFERKRPLWIDDFLDMRHQDAILGLVRKQVADDAGYPDYQRFCEEEFVFINRMPDNFALDDAGLSFIYNDYEASGYRGAPVEVYVGWEALRPFMKDPNMIPRLPIYKQAVEDRPLVIQNPVQIGGLVFGELEDARARRDKAEDEK